jgi:hypothetical protein
LLENELFAILQKYAKQTLFCSFAFPKFATFLHLFASSENLGDTLIRSGLLDPRSSVLPYISETVEHRWASASKKLTPASVFRHPLSQSGTGPEKSQTAQINSGTRLFPVSLIFLSPVPDYPDAGQSGVLALQCCETSPVRGKDFDAALAVLARAPTLLYTRVETKMPFSIFAKMRKSCENGPIFAKFREISFRKNFRFRENFRENLTKFSFSRKF